MDTPEMQFEPPSQTTSILVSDNTNQPKDILDHMVMDEEMAFNCIKPLRNLTHTRRAIGIGGSRTFAVGGGKAKKGSKGGAAGDAPKASTLSKEVKSTTVVGANILKDGTDPKVLADSEYPDWLWHLLDKQPALSELRRKNIESLPYEELKRFVKLDNRARIKENNSIKAKN
ncbi:Ribosomal protein L37, mitochondrial [Dillenia turbinata]|uniref:Large ribosomal subunit protein mL54 n=1 Tax=Dillenia turbinata TaxID=194707 RepID=A0AAN8YUJ9_9MAGN